MPPKKKRGRPPKVPAGTAVSSEQPTLKAAAGAAPAPAQAAPAPAPAPTTTKKGGQAAPVAAPAPAPVPAAPKKRGRPPGESKKEGAVEREVVGKAKEEPAGRSKRLRADA